MTEPRIWHETSGRLAARGILAGIASDERQPFATRLAAMEAVGELQDHLPSGCTLDTVEVSSGTIEQARRLLLDDVEHQPSAREILATSRAAARLASL